MGGVWVREGGGGRGAGLGFGGWGLGGYAASNAWFRPNSHDDGFVVFDSNPKNGACFSCC